MNTYKVVVIPGDGIGPELIDVTTEILYALEKLHSGFSFDFTYVEAGADVYTKTGEAMSQKSLGLCKSADSVLKGPVGNPNVRTSLGTEGGSLSDIMRRGLDLYANVRPITLWPGIECPIKAKPGDIDYVIVRENTEGLYASRNLGVGNNWAMTDTLLMTRPGVERIVRFAFDTSRKRNGAPIDGIKRVTCVDKSNVLRTSAFFRGIFDEIAPEYPDIQGAHLYSDAAGQALVMKPMGFDVLVMENFMGDMLSDVGGGTVGGVGMCPSGNLGDKLSYFEPIHGSAPDIAGKGICNPISQILSAGMMMEWLGENDSAKSIRSAIRQSLELGDLTIQPDGCPKGGTNNAKKAILKYLT